MITPAAAIPTPSRLYRGVRLEPDGRWSAHISEGDGEGRLIGHFRRKTHAALAHDRVAIFLGGEGGARAVNFKPSFNAMERRFLRLRCTEEFVLRAVLDETYEMEYECFLRAEFNDYRCGNAAEETARAVAEFVARERRWWERHGRDKEAAAHRFVMGHINPVYCTSWVALFHEGDPDRSYFSCTEAHEREEKAARLAAEREKAARLAAEREKAAAQEVGVPEPPGGDPEIDRDEEERPASSPVVRPRRARTLLRSLKRWLPRTCFDQFDEQSQRALLTAYK